MVHTAAGYPGMLHSTYPAMAWSTCFGHNSATQPQACKTWRHHPAGASCPTWSACSSLDVLSKLGLHGGCVECCDRQCRVPHVDGKGDVH